MKKKSIGGQLAIVDGLYKELQRLPEPVTGNKKKLEDKYRLDWNGNSNHMEGNCPTVLKKGLER